VLAHSDDLFEVSHGAARGAVRRLTVPQLREVAPELPTLDEALELLGAVDGVGLHVDLKSRGYEASVAETIRRHGLTGRAVVSSCYAASLRELATGEPTLARGLTYPFDRYGMSRRRLPASLTGAALLGIRRALPFRIARLLERASASAGMLHHSVVSRAAVDCAHAQGAAVFAWTVDDERSLARVLAAGVDGVITNDPRIFGHYTEQP
jgi:glycerophosphoryl diester phosphodiesterase